MNLETLLHQTFGHPGFRANQEAVCRAATDGRDVLLVMPTGAGKSLCYQLPAIARGGTALVISPLIALMDDQASKLSHLGLRVARIHSGLSREEARQACRDYLDGTLQFLFIAPERMRVPGFPEMLAKKKPALIAIDEAHCISAWGHDFRPDYRTLGDYLPSLRPAPILALTATATPTVQRDIVAQLQLSDPALFIHGFRRHNLAIEVVELSKPRRNKFTADLLSRPENRPAIVYAPSRKSAEELASMLGGKAAAYHAGLEATVRERVQHSFQTGKLEVVVATIAFGMGIDKADVRTVVHIALPGSVEAYYQEIGRAGRDGQPSRTVLLHSFADRKMHDFFLERDYPAATELARVSSVLTPEFQMPDLLRQRLRMDAATFDRAVEKLASQGAAAIDFEGLVRSTGNAQWRSGYDAQLNFRRSQIDRMVAYTESAQCRMSALIQHFGDTADGLRPCGNCDFCSPERATAQPFRAPNQQETRQLNTILRALDGGSSRATGKLHSDLALGIDRSQFEAYLDALTRSGLITLNADTFTNPEGNVISYKKASLTHEGRNRDESADLPILLRDSTSSPDSKSKSRSTKSPSPRKASMEADKSSFTPAQTELESRIREWRKAEAAKTGKPAFIVFSDAILHSIVVARPTRIPDLLQISGIGPEKADRYGAAILALCNTQPVPGEYGAPAVSTPSPKAAPSRAKQASLPNTRPSEALHRPAQTTPDSNESLTPDQQDLDRRLRDWRKVEAERLGLPQFFVCGSSTLRSVVLQHPRTLDQLRTIAGIGPDKLEKYGASILAVCNT
ncbi:RecQ family ATP-dependent DNA helicase [Granulicella sp. dw_53]|uniref:RecQ family ATP-dependent DNA helicase n=1 Tax=Granulicella sp. dw_53 TaxID=2719792 RepID=UPI001BD34560|nr:RecQ family ATP-dependent DNA helicase [Granulicella sp. dw_53]